MNRKLYPIWKVNIKRYKYSVKSHYWFDSKERAIKFIEKQKELNPEWEYTKPEYIGSYTKGNAEILLGYQIEE